MSEQFKLRRGTTNVFRDVAFSIPEAENLMLRARLMSKIRSTARKSTHAQAAKLFGVTQLRINDLLRGRIDKFSLDALVTMLARAGMRVEVRVRKAA